MAQPDFFFFKSQARGERRQQQRDFFRNAPNVKRQRVPSSSSSPSIIYRTNPYINLQKQDMEREEAGREYQRYSHLLLLLPYQPM